MAKKLVMRQPPVQRQTEAPESEPVDNSESNLLIKHSMVGPYPAGHVVTQQELLDQGANIGRLLNLGAVEYVNDQATPGPLPETMEAYAIGRAPGQQEQAEASGPAADELEDVSEPATGENLAELSVKELREKATLLNIDGARMKREELIAAIQEAEQE